jgi:hypothetical protein
MVHATCSALAALRAAVRARSGSIGSALGQRAARAATPLEMRSGRAGLHAPPRPRGPKVAAHQCRCDTRTAQADGVADLVDLEAGASAAFVDSLSLPVLKAKRLLWALQVGGKVPRTHTRTRTHARARASARTHTRARAYRRTHALTHIRTRTHAWTHARMDARMDARTCSGTPTCARL